MTQYYKKDENGDFVEAKLDEEDINEAVMRRIDRINRKYSDYDDLKQQVADSAEKRKSIEDQNQDLTEKNENLGKEVATAKLAADKVKIMSEFKLKDELAEFVVGNTAEEMRERAEKLSRNTSTSVELNKEDKKDEDLSQTAQLARSLFGQKD